MKVSAKARVRITIDLALEAPWGPECSLGEIGKTAKREALAKLERLCGPVRGVTIVSSEVAAVILTEEKNG